MNKFLNLLWFLGSLFKAVAVNLKVSVPAYKELKEANQRDKLMSSLENVANNDFITKKEEVSDEIKQ